MATIPFPTKDLTASEQTNPSTIVLGGGCFWCVEAVYLPVDGVLKVRSGYAGDSEATANYRAVCSGTTNHAEVVEVTYDPGRISLGRILQLFFGVAHDPTQLNRQGHDRGRQYRSAIFYNSPEQRAFAERYIAELNAAQAFPQPITTTLELLEGFYEAEPYHQNYAARNPAQPYILFTALPKVDKLKGSFSELIKKERSARSRPRSGDSPPVRIDAGDSPPLQFGSGDSPLNRSDSGLAALPRPGPDPA